MYNRERQLPRSGLAGQVFWRGRVEGLLRVGAETADPVAQFGGLLIILRLDGLAEFSLQFFALGYRSFFLGLSFDVLEPFAQGGTSMLLSTISSRPISE